MKTLIALMFAFLIGCAHNPTPVSHEVVIKFESEIPINVSVYKSCEGNWNFCKWQ